jgi:peptidoglycan/xylan/chitin deacetylase (PgdA/CDA1 family)
VSRPNDESPNRQQKVAPSAQDGELITVNGSDGSAVPVAHPLDELLRPAWPTRLEDAPGGSNDGASRIVCVPGDGPPSWLRSRAWRLYVRSSEVPARAAGDAIATFVREDGSETCAVLEESSGNVVVPFSLRDAYASYVSEGWRGGEPSRGLSERTLATFYRAKALIPRRLQLAARRRLIRRQGVPTFPVWPCDTSVSALARFYATCALRLTGMDEGQFTWFWPDGHHAAVVLTHDVEDVGGIRRVLELADLEEERGFRSSFNFGAWYEIDPGILRELNDRGFEVGMHGLTHDRALFASRESFEERLPALAALADRLGAVGFRSPATHRVFSWLAELPVDYDCTMPNSDPYEPIPGGCCTVWPFSIGPVVELPYTLPQDHTLLTLLGHRSPELWLEQAAAIEREYGLIQCVSHPDPGYLGDADKRAIYAAFLEGLAERDGLWRALPREAASWWRLRATSDPTSSGVSLGTASLRTGENSLAAFSPPGSPADRPENSDRPH